MKVFSIILIGVCFSMSLDAQFGINGKYLANTQEWQSFTDPAQEEAIDLLDNGWSVGIDYWFRLKNKRIEFLPELNFTYLSKSLNAPFESKASIYSFYFNTNFYLWDLNGDCDCPTFSKQGPTLEKGLFLQLSPGVSYWTMNYGTENTPIIDDQVFAFNIGGGIGFDLGINDLITITPMLNIRYFPAVDTESDIIFTDGNGTPVPGNMKFSASPLVWGGGLRLGVRLDP